MFNKVAEQSLSRFLAIGVAFTTVFLLTGSVSDPVNVTKLAAAGGVAFSVFLIALILGSRSLIESSKPLLIVCSFFILAMTSAVVSSDSPLSQNLYGTSGRNTGFIFYFMMTMLMLGASLLRSANSFNRLLLALFFAGALNVLYCGWVIIFGDFIGWNNPYKTILGLFGNPNFVSAFLGMFIAAMVAYVFSKNTNRTIRVIGLALSLAAFFEILSSRSIQGIGVTFTGLGIVGFYLIRSKTKSVLPSVGYVLVVSGVGLLGVMGALQKGPLASLIYKTSISLRGQYWEAGIRAGLERPFTGVGMDSYGDWYRRARTEYAATVLPGPSTITNAAHNVVADIFSYGGFPLLASYLATILIGVIAIVRVTLRSREFDGTFVGLAAAWICYQAQALISINQVGLAIWGWALVGALHAYEFSTRPKVENFEISTTKKSSKQSQPNTSLFSPQLIGGIGALVGILIAVPPMTADMRWKSALLSRDVQKVEQALVPGYLQPSNSAKFAQATQLFEQSKLGDLAYVYAKKGVEFNPDYFDAWKVLYFASKATEEDKALALINMKRLDPFNPDVLK
jgi:O-antigen ligase